MADVEISITPKFCKPLFLLTIFMNLTFISYEFVLNLSHAVILEVDAAKFEMYFQKPLCQSDLQLK